MMLLCRDYLEMYVITARGTPPSALGPARAQDIVPTHRRCHTSADRRSYRRRCRPTRYRLELDFIDTNGNTVLCETTIKPSCCANPSPLCPGIYCFRRGDRHRKRTDRIQLEIFAGDSLPLGNHDRLRGGAIPNALKKKPRRYFRDYSEGWMSAEITGRLLTRKYASSG
jgi:hypothetical protein